VRLELDLSYNKMSDVVLGGIMGRLTRLVDVQELAIMLRGNSITSVGCEEFAEKMVAFEKLKELKIDLSANKIDSDGTNSLLMNIKKMQNLKKIYVELLLNPISKGIEIDTLSEILSSQEYEVFKLNLSYIKGKVSPEIESSIRERAKKLKNLYDFQFLVN